MNDIAINCLADNGICIPIATQKIKKVCEFCKDGKTDYLPKHGKAVNAYIKQFENRAYINIVNCAGAITIKYCPECGRKLV